MNTTKARRFDWRSDLEASRSVSRTQRHGFTMLLGWFENFRLRCGLAAGREAAVHFRRAEVLGRGVEREPWQLEQWAAAMAWYLDWLKNCQEEGGDHRSVAERMREAGDRTGARRGLARQTRRTYGSGEWFWLFPARAESVDPESGARWMEWQAHSAPWSGEFKPSFQIDISGQGTGGQRGRSADGFGGNWRTGIGVYLESGPWKLVRHRKVDNRDGCSMLSGS